MSNYFILSWNVKLSQETPDEVIDVINTIADSEPVVLPDDLPGKRAAECFLGCHNGHILFCDQAFARDDENETIDDEREWVSPLQLTKPDNLHIKLTSSINHGYLAAQAFLEWLDPWIINKDEVLLIQTNDQTGENSVSDFGELDYLNECGVCVPYKYKLSHAEFMDIVDYFNGKSEDDAVVKLSNIRGSK